MACAGSNIAATTRAGHGDHSTAEDRDAQAHGRIANLAELIKRIAADGHGRDFATRAGRRTAASPTRMRIRTATRAASLSLCPQRRDRELQRAQGTALQEGHTFKSQTDTEVLAHLIGKHYDAAGGEPTKARLVEALRTALKQVDGHLRHRGDAPDLPDVLVGARRGSPLVLGIGKGENFLASDVSGDRGAHARRGLSERLRHRRADARRF